MEFCQQECFALGILPFARYALLFSTIGTMWTYFRFEQMRTWGKATASVSWVPLASSVFFSCEAHGAPKVDGIYSTVSASQYSLTLFCHPCSEDRHCFLEKGGGKLLYKSISQREILAKVKQSFCWQAMFPLWRKFRHTMHRNTIESMFVFLVSEEPRVGLKASSLQKTLLLKSWP